MGFELEIDGVLVPSKKWSGPGTLRAGYRGPEPGSREAGNANFTVFDTKILKPGPKLALSFDGADDYVEVPDSPLLRFPAVMTVAFWMRKKTINPPCERQIIAKGGNNQVGSFAITESSGGGLNKVGFLQSTDGISWQTQAWGLANTAIPQLWRCYVAVNNGTVAKMYHVTGSGMFTEIPDYSPATGDLWVNTAPLTMGCGARPSDGVKGCWADIELDELVIVPYAWSEAEMRAFYNAGRGSRQFAGERLRWHLDDGGNTARDEASGLVGQVQGALWIPSVYAVPEEENVLVEGKEVLISRNGKIRYRGIITGLDTGKRDTEVETAESSARLNQLDAGMRTFGGLTNPEADWYQRDETIPATADDVEIEGFSVRPESAVTLPAIEYTKETIFDSFVYTAQATDKSARWRTNIWRELPLTTILQEVMAGASRDGMTIGSLAVPAAGVKAQGKIVVYDEGGEKIELGYRPESQRGRRDQFTGDRVMQMLPCGLVNRILNGATNTYLWIVKEKAINLYQVVNHGLAVSLGRTSLGDYNSGSVYLLAAAAGEEWKLTWGLDSNRRGGREDPASWNSYTAMDLRHIRNHISGADLATTLPTISFSYETSTKAVRSGGYYQIDETENEVVWTGDLFLSEMALDFRGAKLGDVLHEVALLTGCEWWIDVDGVLRLERIERATRTAMVKVKRVINDRKRERLDVETYEGFSTSGIPLSEYAAAMLSAELTRISESVSSNVTRRIEAIPDGEPDYSLGAMTVLNGEKVGRLTAIEHTRTMDTLELQPMSEKKPVKK